MPVNRGLCLAAACFLTWACANVSYGQRGDYRGGDSGYGGFRGGDNGGFRGGFPGGGFPGGGYPGGGFPGGGFRGGPGGGFPGGGYPGGGFPGGGFPGGGGYPGFDMRDMLRRADENGNGIIEPNEMQGRSGEFVRRAAERAGLSVTSAIPIDRLAAAMDPASRSSSGSSSGSGSSSSQQPATNPQAFGATKQVALLPGFDTPLSAAAQLPIEKRFDERVLERARERMRDMDRNGNGTLEGEELANYRGDPPIQQSDLNKDGAISLEEMAQRYQARSGPSGGQGGPGGPGGPSYTSSSSGQMPGRPVFMGPSPGGPGTPSGPSTSRGPSGMPTSEADRSRFFAESMIRRNDRNGDGKLQRDEWGSVREPESTDTNRDGVITTEEMAARLQAFSGGRTVTSGGPGGPPGGPSDRGGSDRGSGDRDRGGSSDRDRGGERSFSERGGPPGGERGDRDRRDERSFSERGGPGPGGSGPGGPGGPGGFSSRGGPSDRGGFTDRGGPSSSRGSSSSGSTSANSAPAPKKSYRLSTPSEHLPSGLPSWFHDSDANGDGQISMPEYRRRSSAKDNAEEFVKIDGNADGLITSQECLTYEGSARR